MGVMEEKSRCQKVRKGFVSGSQVARHIDTLCSSSRRLEVIVGVIYLYIYEESGIIDNVLSERVFSELQSYILNSNALEVGSFKGREREDKERNANAKFCLLREMG